MNNLILHCGADAISREAINASPDPESLGPRHAPIHHGEFLDMVESKLEAAGFNVTEQAYGMTDTGRLFGLQTLETDRAREMEGTSFLFGLRASYDQSISAGLCAGSRVFVCDNLAFSGTVTMTTKQTTFLRDRLPALIEDMVSKLALSFRSQTERLESYRMAQISDRTADAAILQLAREGVTNWSNLGRVVREWDEPSHPEHAEDGKSVWRLFNATTEALKIRNEERPTVWTLPERTTKLHRICDELADLPLAA